MTLEAKLYLTTRRGGILVYDPLERDLLTRQGLLSPPNWPRGCPPTGAVIDPLQFLQ